VANDATKPTIHRHFGSKQGRFAAVLGDVYAGLRAYGQAVQTEGSPALEAMRDLIAATFDHHATHPDWLRLIADANLHRAKDGSGSATIVSGNSVVIEIMDDLLTRGVREGVFRAGSDALPVHMLIASFSFYRVSNRHTLIFKRDLAAPGEAAA
jgi:AcrR family transcriptional regulator